MEVIPIVIECMDEEVGVVMEQARKINSNTDKVCREMLRRAVMESERILKKTSATL